MHHWASHQHDIQNTTGAFNELPKNLQEKSEQFAAVHQNAIKPFFLSKDSSLNDVKADK